VAVKHVIDHLSTYATNYDATRRFYEAALAPLGASRLGEMISTWNPEFPTGRYCAFGPGRPVYWLFETRQPASPRHVAFSARTRAAVDAFHRAGLGAGGRDNGAPGLRAIYHPNYYGAFVLDPDGNNVEAVCHAPA
jgi:catechol 2,3-dioxygenase-like lactoylglutathione lyase family enzyme